MKPSVAAAKTAQGIAEVAERLAQVEKAQQRIEAMLTEILSRLGNSQTVPPAKATIKKG